MTVIGTGRAIPPSDPADLFVSPAGTGDGATEATADSLYDAIVAASPGDTIAMLPGSYTGAGSFNKQVTIRPRVGNIGYSVTQTSGTCYPARGSLGSIVLDGVKITSMVGTAGGSEYWTLATPSELVAGAKMGVIYCHGATGDETQPWSSWPFALGNIIRSVVQAGFPVLSIHGGGDTWGNATFKTRMSEAVAAFPALGAKDAPVAVMGGSMGALSLNWVKDHLADTACFVGLTPVTDVTDIHTNNRSGLAGSINTAYSTWSEATYGADHNPATYAASLTGLDYKAWYGASDAIVIPSTVTDIVSDIGGTASAVSVTGDHTTALANIPAADVVAFLVANQS
jgi:hypothetical protein